MSGHKRGQIIKRGDKKFLIRIYTGREQGKRKYSSEMFHGTETEAGKQLTKMLRALDTQSHARKSSLTLKDFLDQWFTKKELGIEPRTLGEYKQHMRLYVVPTLGELKLHEIDTHAVQRVYSAMRARGLSASTIEHCHTTLHQALEWAIQLNHLTRNPTTHTERPSRSNEERTLTVLTPDQMVQFLETTRGDELYPLWLVMLNTGIRPGEALGLKWSDFTGEAGDSFFIQRVLTRDDKGKHYIKERPKTTQSRRQITVPEYVLDVLKPHRARQAADALLYGPRYERNDFVFSTRFGRWLDPESVGKKFKRALKRAGLPSIIRWYDMRHSHATALLSSDVNLAWVSERLGHRDPKMTARKYAKVLPEAHRSMADTMQEIMSTATKKRAKANQRSGG